MCNSRTELNKRFERAYYYALKNGWLDDYTWMDNEKVNLSTNCYLLYRYYFKAKNAIYVGITLKKRKVARHWEHKTGRYKNHVIKDSVFEFAHNEGIDVPEMEVIENNLSIKDAQSKEDDYINKYKKEGFFLINKNKGGSIGALGFRKYTIESAIKEACKYTTRTEVADNDYALYNFLTDFELWGKCATIKSTKETKLEGIKKLQAYRMQERGYTDEELIELMNQFEKSGDFKNAYPVLYDSACNNDLLKYARWHRIHKIDDNEFFARAKSYKSRNELKINEPGAYYYGLKHNLFEKCDWMSPPQIRHSKEEVLEKARLCHSRSEFAQKFAGAYKYTPVRDKLPFIRTNLAVSSALL